MATLLSHPAYPWLAKPGSISWLPGAIIHGRCEVSGSFWLSHEVPLPGVKYVTGSALTGAVGVTKVTREQMESGRQLLDGVQYGDSVRTDALIAERSEPKRAGFRLPS